MGPKTPSTPMAGNVDFALHTLGWKAFQDLALAVASEVLQRPVQVFLPSRDGGRDGAFVGAWPGAVDSPEAKSTIQCKFLGKANASVTLSDVSAELGKISSLAARGLAHDYILLTNANISGESEAEIVAAFEKAGAKRARVFGRDWLTQEIRARPRLRMMVPRLYGLGDLSQIIDERAYLHARYILSAMADDLAAFVTTEAHRQSLSALHQHQFVLLLGDPASGKSTIGASLALGALDDGAIGTVRVSSGEAFERHWNPSEPSQFFWIDDAFGETQYQRSRVDGWNARLKMVRAAVKAGARVLMTSRTYIWNAAKRDLKLSEFPLFTNSQVVIDVQGLSDVERAQILYNHIRRGDQPREWREKAKPFLPAIATNSHFLPETARRLGSRFFTANLELSADSINAFVDEPLEFLKDVLRTLSEPDRAAVALIFLHGPVGVSSPITLSDALETVFRLTGVGQAEVTRAMEALRGSLTLLLEAEGGPRWVFKHPTVADAFAALVAESPEMVELYVRGAKLEKLLSEVVCGSVELAGAMVRVPVGLYETLLARLAERGLLHEDVLRFAVCRGDDALLAALMEREPDLSTLPSAILSQMRWSIPLDFLVKLHANGLLDEPTRAAAIARIRDLMLTWADAEPFRDDGVRALFTDEEFNKLKSDFKSEVIISYGLDPESWDGHIITEDRKQNLYDLRDAIDLYASAQLDDDEIQELAARSADAINAFIETIDDTETSSSASESPAAPATHTPDQIASIFDDVDD